MAHIQKVLAPRLISFFVTKKLLTYFESQNFAILGSIVDYSFVKRYEKELRLELVDTNSS